jgi:hypothetical protein
MTLETAQVDGTMVKIDQPQAILADKAYKGYRNPAAEPGKGQGRCVAILSAPFTKMWNVDFIAGDDDALSIDGDCHGTVIANCAFTPDEWTESKGLICYTNPGGAEKAGPVYKADAGYAGQIIGCRLQGSHTAARIADGIWNLFDNEIWISSLAGLDLMGARCNIVGNRFRTMPQPTGAPYWYPAQTMIPVRVSGVAQRTTLIRSSLFFAGNTLDGKPIDGPGLCRRIGGAPVPSYVFRTTPN